MKLHPAYKEAGRRIYQKGQIFYTDGELAGLLMEPAGTDGFRFAVMNLNEHLLSEYQIDFIRAENPDGEKGYKIATSEESVMVTTQRLARRFRNVVSKQRRVLDTVDRNRISEEAAYLYDRHMVKNGMMTSFLNKTPISRCEPGLMVRIDVPRLIEDK
ncbi:hypothetical protein [uncultured Desulfosarcina sp.]|uniref:hypothetical protein n=1 Tax=uncultured Desulfosarcina sp. TaxID=218289 RepID=UPI0029C99A75|nr:hypothetical protein [uncultured Desulfosarcina sp.]